MSENKSSNNFIIISVIGAVITILVGLAFMSINVSQETNARNIVEIPRLLNRIDTLEKENDRYREYALQLAEEIAINQAEIKSLRSRQDSIFRELVLLESRVFEFIIK